MKPLDSTGPDSETTVQASRGKPLPYTDFQYTTAEFTLPALGEYGLRYHLPTRPAFAPLDPVPVRRLVPLLHASFRPCFSTTPLRFANLHLHQVGIGTSTLLVSRHARHASRHTGLGPVSSQALKTLDSGSAKNAVRNDGAKLDFHVSWLLYAFLAFVNKTHSCIR